MYQQLIVLGVIGTMLLLFIDGRFRYDFVSLGGLLVLAVLGIVPEDKIFSGFSHPAVITVAAVLVISNALISVGVMDSITSLLNRKAGGLRSKILGLMLITAFLSGFMNNVGALAIILPIAIGVAKESNISPSRFLMPVAFSSLLGGMLTSIGTPPNLIISIYRTQAGFEPFAFFDFAKVGFPIIILGILFIVILGFRLIPERKSKDSQSIFKIEDYLSELVVTENSSVIGHTLKDLAMQYKFEIEVLSIIRNKVKIIAPTANEQLMEGDVIVVKSPTEELVKIIEETGVDIKGSSKKALEAKDSKNKVETRNIDLVEVVLRSDSLLVGRTAMETKLRNRFNVNLVAVSRKGVSSFKRLRDFRFQAGDILLLQIPADLLHETYSKLGCLPLAEREIDINVNKKGNKPKIALSLFASAIILTSLGFIPVQLAFSITAILLLGFKIITPREFYRSIEWSTIFMLAALLPLGDALQSSGASDTIASGLTQISYLLPAWAMIVVIMLINMTLTNLIGNSASAVLMAPIALSLATSMGVSQDPFLISVAVASSSAFMTPIGHQSNMLVMGPGGYKFTDYWKLGLPLSILVIVLGTPLILYFWPL